MVKFAVVLEHDIESKVYVTYVPALGGISTYGDTEDEAIERTREMIEGWFKAARKHLPDRDREHTKLLELELAVG